MDDGELLEILLAGRRGVADAEVTANLLLETFGTAPRALAVRPDRLRSLCGLSDDAVAALKAAEALGIRMARARVPDTARPLLDSLDAITDWCRTLCGHRETEEFHLLFLDRRNVLIADERHQHGTVAHTPAYTREICVRALETGASAVVAVHNHPNVADRTMLRCRRNCTPGRKVPRFTATLCVCHHDWMIESSKMGDTIMFEDLFRCAATIERQWNAPLVAERVEYLQYLDTVGVLPRTLAKHAAFLLRLIHLLDLTEPRTVSVAEVEEAAREWWRPGMNRYRRRAARSTRAHFTANSLRWLRFLHWLEEPEKPSRRWRTPEVAAFAAWARDERGYADATVLSCCEIAEDFFRFLAENDTPLSSVSIIDVDRAIAAKSARAELSRRTIESMANRLRMFFRFAEDQSLCKPGIAAAITFPRIWVNDDVPTGLKREHVVRLLATTEGASAVDKRDRAILMLLATYGLRSKELRELQLDHFDWERETLRVRRSKSGRTHVYPLSVGVGEAVLRYLREVRPRHPDRTLFLTLDVPFRPLSQVYLGRIVRGRLQTLGIVTGRRGPHALRHAAAQHLLDQGMSMKVIGDFLGHRSLSTTSVYAKLDLNALRKVADFDLEGLA